MCKTKWLKGLGYGAVLYFAAHTPFAFGGQNETFEQVGVIQELSSAKGTVMVDGQTYLLGMDGRLRATDKHDSQIDLASGQMVEFHGVVIGGQRRILNIEVLRMSEGDN